MEHLLTADPAWLALAASVNLVALLLSAWRWERLLRVLGPQLGLPAAVKAYWVGSLFGKQKLQVWGIGEVNKKSVAGTWACFLTSFGLCSFLVFANGLPPVWIALAFAISVSNTVFELFSPRGPDDFTMATANALVCWAFGAIVY